MVIAMFQYLSQFSRCMHEFVLHCTNVSRSNINVHEFVLDSTNVSGSNINVYEFVLDSTNVLGSNRNMHIEITCLIAITTFPYLSPL